MEKNQREVIVMSRSEFVEYLQVNVRVSRENTICSVFPLNRTESKENKMAFCSKCGKELAIATSLCEGCRTATNSTLVITQNPSVSDAENLKLFIGKNYEYFFKKWTIAEKRRSKLSWNWAAFLLGFSWMAYRKNVPLFVVVHRTGDRGSNLRVHL